MSKTYRATDIDRIEVQQHLQRLWGNCLVRDAKTAFKLFVRQEDIDAATPKQPGGCVFARCFNRVCGTGKVLFFRTVAYLEMPDETGEPVIERYSLPASMSKLIADFDKNGGKNLKAGTGFTLRPPNKTHRLNYLRKKTRKRRKANPARERIYDAKHREKIKVRRAALLVGSRRSIIQSKKGTITTPIHMDTSGMEVRNGVGMIHFLVG